MKTKPPTKAELLNDLEGYERLREGKRRQELWADYHACCEALAHIGKQLELLAQQEEGAL